MPFDSAAYLAQVLEAVEAVVLPPLPKDNTYRLRIPLDVNVTQKPGEGIEVRIEDWHGQFRANTKRALEEWLADVIADDMADVKARCDK